MLTVPEQMADTGDHEHAENGYGVTIHTVMVVRSDLETVRGYVGGKMHVEVVRQEQLNDGAETAKRRHMREKQLSCGRL